MGYGEAFAYASAAEVFDELTGAWNPKTGYDIRGASHARFEGDASAMALPARTTRRTATRSATSTTVVSQTLFTAPDGAVPRIAFPTPSGRAPASTRAPACPRPNCPDDDFPFAFNTGRLPHQWHTMTKTGKIPALNKLNPSPFVEIHPEDAGRLGIRDKDRVEIRSRRGAAVIPASVTDRVMPGSCFTPFHWADVFAEDAAVNAVTADDADPVSHQPGPKYCAVALTRVQGRRRGRTKPPPRRTKPPPRPPPNPPCRARPSCRCRSRRSPCPRSRR